MKKKLLILSALAICLATLAAGSLAYFTSEEQAHNVITSGSVKIDLREWADEARENPFENLTGVMPGQNATKIVEVANIGASKAWIRARYDVSINDGKPYDPELVQLDLNTEYWTYKDGWFYYNAAVAPEEVTKPLFTTVHFDARMGNGYQSREFHVNVVAQAVQTANNGESALEANGWTEYILE